MPDSVVLERIFASTPDRQQFVKLRRQRVYILPTREGLILSVVLVAMLLGAINYNNNMAYLLTFLLGTVFIISMLHTWRNLAGLIITGSMPRPVYAGETALFPLIINNHEGYIRTAITLACAPHRNKGTNKDSTDFPPVYVDLPADHWQQIEIRKTAVKRGFLLLGRVVISTRYPLGLFRAWSYITIDERCLVYPRPEGNKQLPAPQTTDEPGQSGIKTGADDFAGFRHYHAGDSIRNIAWKVLAREQPLLIKRFSGEGNRTLMLTWNSLAHLPDTETRLSQLCLWVLQAEQEGCNYGLDIPGRFMEPAIGTLHKSHCLEALACFGSYHERPVHT